MPNKPKLVGLVDAAFALRIPYRKAYELALTGQLEARRDGRTWLVTSASVNAYRTRQSADAPAEVTAA